jgi:hypothetical protein
VTPDEQFWGPPRRRVPLSRSMLVNFMGLALALLVAATVIGVVTLTTALAALLAPRMNDRQLAEMHAHAH